MRTKRKIRTELAAAVAEPEPDPGKIEELTEELRRARGGRPRRRRTGMQPGVSDDPERSALLSQDPDQEAISTWPPELRARLRPGGINRVIDRPPVDDPAGHGQRNDLRRWSPWR